MSPGNNDIKEWTAQPVLRIARGSCGYGAGWGLSEVKREPEATEKNGGPGLPTGAKECVGSEVSVDPSAGNLSVHGRKMTWHPLLEGHCYRFFLRAFNSPS